MKNLLKKLKNKKGFTLAELLIVVAIIAVLVAISIPIFNTQLEKAREATDAANLRAAYAEVMAAALTEDTANDDVTINKDTTTNAITTITTDVDCTQKKANWDSTNIEKIGNVAIDEVPATKLSGWTVTFTQSTGKVTFVEK